MIDKYHFPNLTEIICKICVQAVIHNHISILEYFLTPVEFSGAPDKMVEFLLNSIRFGGHLDVVKFFIQNGVSIRRCAYEPVRQAIKYERAQIIQYFCQIDDTVIDLLTEDQKEKFGLIKTVVMDQQLADGTVCNISYDEILENHTYYQCSANSHHYKEDIWNQWINTKPNCICPCCRSNIKRILYVNKKKNFEN